MRVDDFWKIIARVLPASAVAKRSGCALTSAVRANSRSTCPAVRSWIEIRWRCARRGRHDRSSFGQSTVSRSSGMVMQRGPPRARDSSLPSRVTTVGPRPSTGSLPVLHLLLADDPPAAGGQLLAGAAVAAVEDDHPGGDGEGVGAVGPLLALLVEDVGAAAARHQLDLQAGLGQRPPQRRADAEAELSGLEVDLVDVRRLRGARLDHRPVAEAEAAVDEGEDGVEVHVGAPVRQLDDDQAPEGGLLAAQVLGQVLHPPAVGALADPQQHHLRAGHQQVAPLEVAERVAGVVLRAPRRRSAAPPAASSGWKVKIARASSGSRRRAAVAIADTSTRSPSTTWGSRWKK